MGPQLIDVISVFFESGSIWAALIVAVLLFFVLRGRSLSRFRFRCDISWEGDSDKGV